MARAVKQIELKFRTWGGKRCGAGRKRVRAKASVPHRARPRFKANHPLHVTLRVVSDAPNLRSVSAFPVVREALRAACERFGCRIVHFSVQQNHIHLIAEAPSWNVLSNAIRGFSIRLAHRINAAFARAGKLFDGRYHLRVLKTPLEVKRALLYVLQNWLHHGGANATRRIDPCSSAAAFDGWKESLPAPPPDIPVAKPRLWLVTVGWWKVHGKLSLTQSPA